MGQIARMNRACRFIDEFREELTPTLTLQPGMNLTVKAVSLALREGSAEEVVAVALLQGVGGLPEVEVELDEGVLFDPEYSDVEHAAEWLADRLNLDYDEVLQRLERKVERPTSKPQPA